MPSSPSGSVVFRFAAFEFCSASNRLLKHGIRLPLERKPALVLRTLLENRDRVVTREELQRILWPDGTFVDFELGLRVAINKARLVLGDSADSPTFIETVVGTGYRWIAPVEEDAAPAAKLEIVALPLAAALQPAPRRPFWQGAWVRAAAAGLVLAAAILTLIAARSRPRISYQASDWVLVSDFDNRTGDTALDGVLKPALERELNNSHFIHVVPAERVNDVLALMRRPPGAAMDQSIAREVCLRDGGIKLLLSGHAQKLGTNLLLSADIMDPRTGATLHSASAEAHNENEVISALHRLGDDLRGALGEEVSQIKLSDQQFEKVTTPSLKALKLFAAGYDFQLHGDASRAADFLEQAVQADPDFASAWLYLGWARFNMGPAGYRPEFLAAFRRAFELSGRVTERERLFILQSWYDVTGDTQQAIHYGDLLIRLYPDHYWGINNQAGLLEGTARDEEGLQLAKLCFRIRPQFNTALGLWGSFHWEGNESSAQFYLQQARQLAASAPDSGSRLPLVESSYPFERADPQAVLAAIRSAHPVTSYEMYLTGSAFAAIGRLREAESASEGEDHSRRISYVAAFLRGGRSAIAHLPRRPDPVSPFASLNWILIVSSFPDSAQARAALAFASNVAPAVRPAWSAAVRGELALGRGDFSVAERELRSSLDQFRVASFALPPTSRMFLADSLASACERRGKVTDAIHALEANSQIDGDPSWMVFWPLLQRHLADLYRQTGQSARAEAIEQKLSKLLALADPDYSLDAQRGLAPARHLLAASQN